MELNVVGKDVPSARAPIAENESTTHKTHRTHRTVAVAFGRDFKCIIYKVRLYY
jgi:hypothetical protein